VFLKRGRCAGSLVNWDIDGRQKISKELLLNGEVAIFISTIITRHETRKKITATIILTCVMLIAFSVNSFCPPPYTSGAGTLVPYKENGQLVGERCVELISIQNCNCIGTIYWY
jgi:hypothetical protein